MPDFPTSRTSPSDSSAGDVEPRSRSLALSDAHESGAKYCSSDISGLSSSTESLSSYASVARFHGSVAGGDPHIALGVDDR